MDLMAAAAAEYMSRINHDWEIRFDVVSVVLPAGRSPVVRHLPDAFFPGL
jgi:putative endonuclease